MSQHKVETIKNRLRGRWIEVLSFHGIDLKYLNGRPGPCPFCKDGTDRWVFDNKNGSGGAFCRKCGPLGDGISVLAKHMGLDQTADFPKILDHLAAFLGDAPTNKRTKESSTQRASIVWDSSEQISQHSPAAQYLKARGLEFDLSKDSLRYHPGLEVYGDGNQKLGQYPALVAAAVDKDGKLTGVQRIFLTETGKKADLGSHTKKALGCLTGSSVRLSNNVGVSLGIAEGIETALAVQTMVGIPMYAAISGPAMKSVQIPKHVEFVQIWADKDSNGAGEKYALEAAKAFKAQGKFVSIHLPPGELPDGSKGIDWNDILLNQGIEEFCDSVRNGMEYESTEVEWPQIIDLPSTLAPVPVFHPNLLPDNIRPWLEDLADRMHLPLEFFVGSCIAMLGSAIGRRCGIFPKQEDDWLVIPCLWGALVAPPSVMKTPAMKATMGPLKKLESVARKEYDDALAIFEKKCEVHSEINKELVTKFKKEARAAGSTDPLRQKLEEIQKSEIELEQQKPKLRRHLVNDATVEKLHELMSENPMGLMQFRDELYGLLKTLDKPGHENDRAFLLEAWNGLGSFTVDRIGRGTTHVKSLCLSIFGAIQPDRLRDYFSNQLSGKGGDDGFLARFQLIFYPDIPKTWKYVDRRANREAHHRVEKILMKIVETDFSKIGIEVCPHNEVPAFRFNPEAQIIFKNWLENFQQRLLTSSDEASFISHLGKYRSLLPALALIFHLVENIEMIGFISNRIGPENLERAIQWVELLEKHARRVYGQTLDSDLHAAHALARRIKSGDILSGTSIRSIYRCSWSGLTDADLVKSGLSKLESFGWLKVIQSENQFGPASEIIMLNPQVEVVDKGSEA